MSEEVDEMEEQGFSRICVRVAPRCIFVMTKVFRSLS